VVDGMMGRGLKSPRVLEVSVVCRVRGVLEL